MSNEPNASAAAPVDTPPLRWRIESKKWPHINGECEAYTRRLAREVFKQRHKIRHLPTDHKLTLLTKIYPWQKRGPSQSS